MKHKFTKLIIGLVIAVLILCAVLPWMVANIGDRLLSEKVYSAELKTVQLAKELTDLEKIYLLNSGLKMEINEERTRLKTEDMKEILTTSLEPYIDSGLIQETMDAFTIVSCEPYRYYSDTISNLSGTFWKIQLESWDSIGQSLIVCLDDQSGKVLELQYECLEPIYDSYKLEYICNQYMNLYVENLELDYTIDEMLEVNKDHKSAYSMRIYQFDPIYGENGVMFTVATTGVRISIQDASFFTEVN